MNVPGVAILIVTLAQAAADEPVPQTSWVGPVFFLAILVGIVIYVMRHNRRK